MTLSDYPLKEPIPLLSFAFLTCAAWVVAGVMMTDLMSEMQEKMKEQYAVLSAIAILGVAYVVGMVVGHKGVKAPNAFTVGFGPTLGFLPGAIAATIFLRLNCKQDCVLSIVGHLETPQLEIAAQVRRILYIY